MIAIEDTHTPAAQARAVGGGILWPLSGNTQDYYHRQ